MKVSPEVLAQRLTNSRNVRPLVQGKTGDELIAYIKEKLKSRELFYNRASIVADAEVLDLSDYLRVLEGSGIS
jgi:shikimate kinase